MNKFIVNKNKKKKRHPSLTLGAEFGGVTNSGKGVSIPCHVPPLLPRQGLGRDKLYEKCYVPRR